MIEKILKDPYVNPKVELTQKEYNDLVAMARMNAKKIKERAREIYEHDGVTEIQFTGKIYRKQFGEVECDQYKFTCDCNDFGVTPTGDYQETLYKIPQESRAKIAKHVKMYVEDVFYYYFGEHLTSLNEILRLKHKQQRETGRFLIFTITGWLLAIAAIVFMFVR